MPNTDAILLARRARRTLVNAAEVAEAQRHGVLVDDPQRARPRYFDGRFLSAQDLGRDQDYLALRQRELARLGGEGIVAGLEVERGEDPVDLVVRRGHGVTRAGELVVVLDNVEISLSELATLQRLDATFDLDERPRPPARTHSGVFVLAVRPVEFSSNPVAPYPRNIVGERRLEDGDVVEASLLTLWPLPHISGIDIERASRADFARQVFVEGLELVRSDHGLPLAIVAIERGRLAWIDVHLARRELVLDPAVGFGAGPRARLEAFARHYAAALSDILVERATDELPLRFAARDYFEALPSAGPLPPEAIQLVGEQIVQWFLPPTIDAEIAVVPDDELPGLIEDSLQLEPIDLTADAAVLESLPVLIAVPVARAEFGELVRALGGVTTRAITRRLGRTLAGRRPIDALLRRVVASLPLAGEPAPVIQAWQAALAAAPTLYFVRQRRRAQAPFAQARYGPLPPELRPSSTIAEFVRARLDVAGELARFDRLLATASGSTIEALELTLSRPVFDDPLFINGLVAELSYRARRRLFESGANAGGDGVFVGVSYVPAGAPLPLRLRPLSAEVVASIAARYEHDSLAGSLASLVIANAEFADFDVRIVLAQTLRVPELARRVPMSDDPAFLPFAARLLELVHQKDVNGIRDLIGRIRLEPPPVEPPEGAGGFEAANALGEGGLYVALWRDADLQLRQAMDVMLSVTGNLQPLLGALLLVRLFIRAWRVSIQDRRDADVMLEAIYAWSFEPETELRVPTISTPPGDVISANEVADEIDQMTSATALHGLNPAYAQASTRLRDAGFPATDLDPVEAVRLLAIEGFGFEFVGYVVAIDDDPDLSLEEFALRLSAAVRTRNLEELRSIQAWLNDNVSI